MILIIFANKFRLKVLPFEQVVVLPDITNIKKDIIF